MLPRRFQGSLRKSKHLLSGSSGCLQEALLVTEEANGSFRKLQRSAWGFKEVLLVIEEVLGVNDEVQEVLSVVLVGWQEVLLFNDELLQGSLRKLDVLKMVLVVWGLPGVTEEVLQIILVVLVFVKEVCLGLEEVLGSVGGFQQVFKRFQVSLEMFLRVCQVAQQLFRWLHQLLRRLHGSLQVRWVVLVSG